MAKLVITEGQCREQKPSGYRYLWQTPDGLHLFREEGSDHAEAFARRKPGNVSGWHLERGAYWYEFISSREIISADYPAD